MTCLDLEVSLDCAGCGSNVPVNAFVSDITCWSCERHSPLDGTVWRLLLEEPLRDASSLAPGVQKNATLRTDIGTFRRVLRSADPICGDCKTAIPADHARNAVKQNGGQHAHCPSCKHPFTLRAAPAGLAALGVVALAGESEEQMRGARAHRAPVPLVCTSCGGGLHVDGSSRVVKCPFCSSDQYLPAELFASLRSVPVRVWSLVLAGGGAPQAAGQHAPAPALAHAEWTMIFDAVVDAQGNIAAWGMPVMDPQAKTQAKAAMRAAMMEAFAGGGMAMPGGALWSMGPDGSLRWRREGLSFDATSAKLSLSPSGHVLIWDGTHAEIVEMNDGATVFRFSGAPGEGAQLETRGAKSLTIDADGSIVVISQDGHLLRTTAQGQPIAMWGAGPREQPHDHGQPWVFELGNKPPRVAAHALLGASWDGTLHIGATILVKDALHVATYDRSGKRIYMAECPMTMPYQENRVLSDASGVLYIIAGELIGMGQERTVFRVDPRAGTAAQFLTPRSKRGLLGNEHVFCVTPNGTLFALGNGGAMRRFGPDGRVQHMSSAAASFDGVNH
jgi:hypothetical protein